MKKLEGWQDALEVVVSLWILFSPLALSFGEPKASLTFALIGTAVLLVSQLGLAQHLPWEEWTNLALGAVLVVSPWLLGYSHLQVATWNALACGAVLAVLTVSAIVEERMETRAKPTEPQPTP